MITSVDIRIKSMLSALTGAVIPALSGNAFAAEQAQLIAGHLNAMRETLNYADDYERLELMHSRALAEKLIISSDGGSETVAAVEALRTEVSDVCLDQIADVRASQYRITAAVADLIEAQGRDGTSDTISSSTKVVAKAEAQQSIRDRSFFAPFGYEDGSRSIPPIADVLKDIPRSI